MPCEHERTASRYGERIISASRQSLRARIASTAADPCGHAPRDGHAVLRNKPSANRTTSAGTGAASRLSIASRPQQCRRAAATSRLALSEAAQNHEQLTTAEGPTSMSGLCHDASFGELPSRFDVGALYYWYPGDYPVRLQQPRHRRALLRHQRRQSFGAKYSLCRSPTCSATPTRTAAAISTSAPTGNSSRPGRSTPTAASSGSRTTRSSSTPTGSSA